MSDATGNSGQHTVTAGDNLSCTEVNYDHSVKNYFDIHGLQCKESQWFMAFGCHLA